MRINKQKGFSLIQLMVALGIASIISVAVGTLIFSINKSFKQSEITLNLGLLQQDIKTLLVSRLACLNTFGRLGPLAPATTYTMNDIVDDATTPRYVNTTVNPTISYIGDSIRIETIEVLNYVTPAVAPAPTAATTFDVRITYSYTNLSVQPPAPRVFTLQANVDAANNIVSCYSDVAADYDARYINSIALGPPLAPSIMQREVLDGDLDIVGILNVVRSTNPIYAANPGGYIVAAEYFQVSDQRLKENVQVLSESLSKINKIRGVEFIWRDTQRKDWGFIAQEIEKEFPFLVRDSKDGIKSVSYNGLIALSVEAIKTLELENKNLQNKFNTLVEKTDKFMQQVCSENQSYEFCSLKEL